MERYIIGMPEISIGYMISRTALYLKISALQFFKNNEYNVTPEQFGILYILSRENGLYQRQLSKMTLKDRPNITRIIDILEKRGLIYRELDPENRRIFKVFITEEGRQQVEDILPSLCEFRDKTIEGLSQEDLNDLKRILGKIRSNLDATFKLQT
jgi:DNA-binding MarR family transcriptional regulator